MLWILTDFCNCLPYFLIVGALNSLPRVNVGQFASFDICGILTSMCLFVVVK